jgi:hypothetical protein
VEERLSGEGGRAGQMGSSRSYGLLERHGVPKKCLPTTQIEDSLNSSDYNISRGRAGVGQIKDSLISSAQTPVAV